MLMARTLPRMTITITYLSGLRRSGGPALLYNRLDLIDVLLLVFDKHSRRLTVGWRIRVRVVEQGLDRGQDRGHIVDRAPLVL